ncbi:TPA: lipoprotein insertase outer membrane protein LolB [Yersinia enterocolitica]|uniref:Outer-membrane lipoprotein LolB n=2 Tax=Yersinia enterocolitica TaxID=630 RepID=A0A0E1NHR7_YEREN|nr:lipoprotein insertase outer membrane protein LolB [Yersinia enterocolitica]CBX73361.1 outer-membrane lipoprotein lolB [Yersinia enterocolitica W22703]ADZ42323.1 outer membrane lipoprotein LolB [Yersinia enterocolitica subsp. palearctica 105.5R(r)]AJJ26982.1 outer membrane lipoprotein LolB [Yersinia enterocolitica]ALG78466.1 membrane protein [Yersinia enterocolitica]EKN3326741.1 lipoprotein localization protein LolB [Yersinia enterocolitica]
MPQRKISFYRLLPLATLLLAACSTTPPSGPATSPTSPQWRQHEQQLQQLSQFQTRGAFAYLSEKQKVYARFFWQQTAPERYRLLLTNPLGSTELELVVQPGVTQLTDNQGKRYVSNDPQEMIQKLTGMSIPLESLRQWILGLPGDTTDFTLDDKYRLKQLTYQQDGVTWVVDYQEYNTQITPALPSRMELSQGGQRIKLKMDNWTVK